MPAIIAAQASDSLAVDVSAKLVDWPVADVADTTQKETQCEVVVGALTYWGRIYVPAVNSLHGKLISLFHGNPESSHFGALKTTELVSRHFYWAAMDSHVHSYVSSCEICHRIKAPRHTRHGINMLLETPSLPWEDVTMDMVTNLPESTASGYTTILVIVDRLTKMAIYLPCWKNIDSPEVAQLLFEHVICKHSILDNKVTDRGTQFTSQFWNWVCSHFSTDHRLLTAFHPQMDRQTEGQNQMMEQYLRTFCNYEQDNWVELWPLAEFAYNIVIHVSTRMTPFWANYHYHPVMQFKDPKQPSSLNLEIQADTFAAGLEKTHQSLRQNLQEAQASQTKYAGGKEIVFEVEDKVWILTWHFRMTRQSKKLDYKRAAQYTVSKVIDESAYKLDLPYTIRKHNIFHISLLDHYTPPTGGQLPSKLQPMVIDDSDELEVDWILDSKRCYWKLHYLVQWAGYSYVRTSWQPVENLGNVQEWVDEYHRGHPRKPLQWLDGRSGMGRFRGVFTLLTFIWISAQYKWHQRRFLLPPETSRVEVEFRHPPNPPWGCS